MKFEMPISDGDGGDLLEGYAPSLSYEDRHGLMVSENEGWLSGGGWMGYGVTEKVRTSTRYVRSAQAGDRKQ